MSLLFKELNIKGLSLKNRVVMAPMCTNSAVDGYSNDWHYVHYGTRAVGGVGLIILEATAVERRGLICPDDLGIWDDSHIEGLKSVTEFCKDNGAKIGIQLSHAGRKCELENEEIIAPSSLAYNEEYMLPKKMTLEDINEVINSFKEGARRALKAGFDTIELHGAHGYLIGQFLSPLTNKRDDEYGGSPENRIRFLKEILREVKMVWPEDKPIVLRVSAEEYDENGNDPIATSELINLVKEFGIDIVNVSSGGVVPAKITTYPGYQIDYSQIVKNKTKLPTMGGGLITSPLMAEEILRNNRADLIYLGRELLRNPYWTLQAAKILEDDITWPIQYERSKKVRKNGF